MESVTKEGWGLCELDVRALLACRLYLESARQIPKPPPGLGVGRSYAAYARIVNEEAICTHERSSVQSRGRDSVLGEQTLIVLGLIQYWTHQRVTNGF